MIKIKLLALLIITLLNNISFSYSNTPEMRNELRKSIEKYRDENIFPKMLEWKDKIDKTLTSEELKSLNKLREDFKVSKDKIKTKVTDVRSDIQKGYKVDKEKFHYLMDDYRDEMKKYGKAVKPLAIAHLDAFKKIGEEAKPFKSKWKEDLTKIFEDWKKNNPEIGNKPNFNKFGEGMMGMQAKDKLMALYLILWDGNKDHFMNEMESTKPEFDSKEENDNFAYPNPFDKVANIDFSLKNKENVKVTVLDKNGNVVATLVNSELSQGFHSLSFNPNDYNIPNGMYLYKIESISLNKTGKLILSK